ncbi:MAG: hypothetical protein KGZ97_05310 [Bacteroidetes bacterium]|nr:hypothetical protein [Bacteroidota bacterium]
MTNNKAHTKTATFIFTKIASLFLLMIIYNNSFSNNEPPVFDFTFEIKAETDFFAVDQFSNIYWIENGALKKFINESQNIISYSDKKWGDIQLFDSSDPLHIIVLYKEFNKIVFLDGCLAPKKTKSNDKLLNEIRPTLICSSAQNGFWAYSPNTFKLYRISEKFKIEVETDALNQRFPELANPFHMTESGDKLFISDQNSGIWVFDRFGNFMFLIPIKDVSYFQVKDNSILYFNENQLGLYDFEQHFEEFFLLPDTNIVKGYIYGMTLYLLTSESIKQYKIK